MIVTASFSGDLADYHTLPGYEGAQSIEGIARALTLCGHYLVTGTIRKRYPFSSDFHLALETFEEGSFRTRFGFNISPTAATAWLGATIGVGLLQGFAYDLVKYSLTNVVGISHTAETPALNRIAEQRPGDLDALREALSPAAKKSHTVIGNGANSLIIIGDNNNIVTYNNTTKSYLEDSELDESIEIKLASVGMLNVNTRFGRIFDFELGRTVPITVSRDCQPRTLENLAQSLRKYARDRQNSQLYIKYTIRRDISGNPERYYIYDAWFDGDKMPAD